MKLIDINISFGTGFCFVLFFNEQKFSFHLGKHLGVKLLDCMLSVCLSL